MDLSFSEMIVIGVIAFLVLGPEEMAKKAAQLGRFLGKMRSQMDNFKVMANEELLKDIKLDDLDVEKKVHELETEIKAGVSHKDFGKKDV